MAGLGFVLPFELSAPVASVAGHNLRSVSATAALVVGIVVVATGRAILEGRSRHYEAAVIALVFFVIVGTVLADGFVTQAGMSARRTVTAIAVGLVAGRVLKSGRDRALVATAFAVGAGLSAIIGILVLFEAPGLEWTSQFRGQTVTLGTRRRFTLPYGHPNVAAGHLLAAVWISIGLLTGPAGRRRPVPFKALLAISAIAAFAGLALTFSRGAAVAALMSIPVAWMAGRDRSFRPLYPQLVAAFALSIVAVSIVSPTWRSRFADPSFDVAPAGQPANKGTGFGEMVVTNSSETNWSDGEFSLLREQLKDGNQVVAQDVFPVGAVRAGQSVSVDTLGPAIAPDATHMRWEIVLTGTTLPAGTPDFYSAAAAIDHRRQLWAAAVELTSERPLLGVGPGNFRLHFQDKVSWDGAHTTHAHSIIFEPLASWGLLGSAAFFAAIGFALRNGWRGRSTPMDAALFTALITALVLGLSDYLLASASGELTFFLLLGLVGSSQKLNEHQGVRSGNWTRDSNSSPAATHRTTEPLLS